MSNELTESKIIYRAYYAIKIKLASPLSISGGTDEYTDSDVLVNGNGEPFIPGTSIAGAFRNYLGDKKNSESLMGFSDSDNGRMSSVFISDVYFENPSGLSVTERDGVQLNENKTVENKFDMQIVETGAKGILYIQCVKRENDKPEYCDFHEMIQRVICALNNGEIRLGHRKNRGFGRLKVCEVRKREFDFTGEDREARANEWIEFQNDYKNYDKYEEQEEHTQSGNTNEKYLRITVPLKLSGGISIRKYSVTPMKEDFEHITCNKRPIIPGSSWSGAIRADALKILRNLGCENAENIINYWFGNISGENPSQSRIVVSESVIENSVAIPMTRNQINRFDGSTINGALYSEKAYFGGTTTLEILVKKDEDYKGVVSLLHYVIKDIQDGYLAVGGETAIGRGIFERDDENPDIEYSETIDDMDSQLYGLIS